MLQAPAWYHEAVFYELAPRTFCDGNGDGIGDFKGLTQRLPYLAELGVSCLWLLPMYPSPLRDDGYDISDYRAIHPDLGSLAEFQVFLRDAHALGLRVIADLVLNHTSDQHPWFQAAREGPGHPYHDWYVWSDDPGRYAEARIIFTDTERSNWAWDDQARRYYWHRFFSSQPDLNYDHPPVQSEMLATLEHWLELGLDGFRVDAVPYLFERENTSCENLPETHAFLRRLRARLAERFPEALLLGEANQWPEDVLPYFGTPEAPELPMNFHFPLMPRLFLALAQQRRDPIAQVLTRTPPLPPGCQWATFLRNHDELTLEMVDEVERAAMWAAYAPEPRMRCNVGIRRRLWPLLEGDRRRVELLHALLLSLPGAPVLYYGDEIGMGDDIHRPDRHGVRLPMAWDDGRNFGFSAAPPSQLRVAMPGDPGPYHPLVANVAAARANPSSFWHWLRERLRLRAEHVTLRRGEFVLLAPENPAILAFLRTMAHEAVLVVANMSPVAQATALELSAHTGWRVVPLPGARPFPPFGDEPYPLTLGPYGHLWLQLLPPSR
ncbi:MAG: maltose alpha-D-glucosyltransferase [Candidatus Sericytochromatia bacterium]|nr:maltose alpha-D-glucosyltransferase [Candidatus Sericytochromatia bacterium]